MREKKIISPLILGVILALAVTGAYTLAHTGENTVETPIQTGTPNTSGGRWGGVHMGMMGGMMQPPLQAQDGGYHGFNARGMSGFPGGFATVNVVGTVNDIDLSHHAIVIATEEGGIVEVMVPGLWQSEEGEILRWYELLPTIKAGEEISVTAVEMPCGELVAIEIASGAGVYYNLMVQ